MAISSPVPKLTRILLYVRDVEKTANFYVRFFGFSTLADPDDRIVELSNKQCGFTLMLHRASKGARVGQSTVKLVFDIEDVPTFCANCAEDGLDFGPMHKADGYVFANARDPAGNPISVSSRAFR